MTVDVRYMLVALAMLPLMHAAAATPSPSSVDAAMATPPEKIAPYVSRFGRSRPVIAVLGENSGTVLSDFVIPYGVLRRSDTADVISVATQDGELKLPPLRIVADQTITSFDRAYPRGADYVVVPAVTKRDDPALIAWLLAQAGKGATTSLPLKAICSRIGYADEHNLRRVFVRNFGVNPMQYRARFSERS